MIVLRVPAPVQTGDVLSVSEPPPVDDLPQWYLCGERIRWRRGAFTDVAAGVFPDEPCELCKPDGPWPAEVLIEAGTNYQRAMISVERAVWYDEEKQKTIWDDRWNVIVESLENVEPAEETWSTRAE